MLVGGRNTSDRLVGQQGRASRRTPAVVGRHHRHLVRAQGTIQDGRIIRSPGARRRTRSPTRSRRSGRTFTIVGACIRSTNIRRIVTHQPTAGQGPTVQLLEQTICPRSLTCSRQRHALATGQMRRLCRATAPRVAAPRPTHVRRSPPRLSTATRLSTGSSPSEADTPAQNLDGLELGSVVITAPRDRGPIRARRSRTPNNGLHAARRGGSRQGYAGIVRSVSCRCLRGGTPNFGSSTPAR